MKRFLQVPARRGEVVTYLNVLLNWLSIDPCPREGFEGPTLTPAALERKLRLVSKSQEVTHEFDAEELAQRCKRLVILGGPGSGKTWLAKRTARLCAERALDALTEGVPVDTVELPLYTTCSALFSAHGEIREAAVSSAFDQLGDLGGYSLSGALRRFFMERNAPTLLVIDSLDEAHGSSKRLRQADSLRWRVVLTSRPSSWHRQLVIGENGSDQVGELQPLRYPDDVEPFIRQWFSKRPDRGNDLAAQIAQRRSLQQAATVPLILSFYCIIGAEQPLPDFRCNLYKKVLNHLLTGRWRRSDDQWLDVDACLETLSTWAWAGATSDRISGVGTWADDIPTERITASMRAQLGEDGADALDHLATPLGRPDVDTGRIVRRFIHRSIREHLVAEHIARLTVDQAVQALLPHIWYDPDWESCAPTALVLHPKRDELLRALTRRVVGSDQIPVGLSAIDPTWQYLVFLARIAAESSEAEWSREVTELIAQARLELASPAHARDLIGAPHWETSNRQVREKLLSLLAVGLDGQTMDDLVDAMVRITSTAEDKRLVREALVSLANQTASAAKRLVAGVMQLDPTVEDKQRAREALLSSIDAQVNHYQAIGLVERMMQLDPTEEDKRHARMRLLGLLAEEADRRKAARLACQIRQLDPTAEDRRQARERLLGLLAGQTSARQSEELVSEVVQLAATVDDKDEAAKALLDMLVGRVQFPDFKEFVSGAVQLAVTAESRRRAREQMQNLLVSYGPWATRAAVSGALQLSVTVEDKRNMFDALLRLLAQASDLETDELLEVLVQLPLTAADRRRAGKAVLSLIIENSSQWNVVGRAAWLMQFDLSAEDKRRVREALLRLPGLSSRQKTTDLGRHTARVASGSRRQTPHPRGTAQATE